MLGGEGISVVLGGELALLIGVKDHLERGHVRLNENIWCDDLRRHVDTLAVLRLCVGQRWSLRVNAGSVGAGLREAWVLMRAHVVPGPSVEAALLDGGYVVGHEVVAQVV